MASFSYIKVVANRRVALTQRFFDGGVDFIIEVGVKLRRVVRTLEEFAACRKNTRLCLQREMAFVNIKPLPGDQAYLMRLWCRHSRT